MTGVEKNHGGPGDRVDIADEPLWTVISRTLTLGYTDQGELKGDLK